MSIYIIPKGNLIYYAVIPLFPLILVPDNYKFTFSVYVPILYQRKLVSLYVYSILCLNHISSMITLSTMCIFTSTSHFLFYLLVIANSAAMNLWLHFVGTLVFHVFYWSFIEAFCSFLFCYLDIGNNCWVKLTSVLNSLNIHHNKFLYI